MEHIWGGCLQKIHMMTTWKKLPERLFWKLSERVLFKVPERNNAWEFFHILSTHEWNYTFSKKIIYPYIYIYLLERLFEKNLCWEYLREIMIKLYLFTYKVILKKIYAESFG